MEAIYLALYLQHLGMSTGSRAAIEEAVQAFARIHQAAELPSPTNDPVVKAVLEGLCRILALPTVKKRLPYTVKVSRLKSFVFSLFLHVLETFYMKIQRWRYSSMDLRESTRDSVKGFS